MSFRCQSKYGKKRRMQKTCHSCLTIYYQFLPLFAVSWFTVSIFILAQWSVAQALWGQNQKRKQESIWEYSTSNDVSMQKTSMNSQVMKYSVNLTRKTGAAVCMHESTERFPLLKNTRIDKSGTRWHKCQFVLMPMQTSIARLCAFHWTQNAWFRECILCPWALVKQAERWWENSMGF